MSDMEGKQLWDKLARPPKRALKQISGGRLKGMTDVNPQWRYEIMTEVFGPCGIGWTYEVVRLWTEDGPQGQVFAFAEILLRVKDEEWSAPIPGVGGNMLVVMEKAGLHANDEAYKMAITDALSVAMKSLGVAADIYAGLWDGSKYQNTKPEKAISKEQAQDLEALIDEVGGDLDMFLKGFKIESLSKMPLAQLPQALKAIEKKRQS
jgi:hypothetical protein